MDSTPLTKPSATTTIKTEPRAPVSSTETPAPQPSPETITRMAEAIERKAAKQAAERSGTR